MDTSYPSIALESGGRGFTGVRPSVEHYINFSEIDSYDLHPFSSFLVVKGVFDRSEIAEQRESYYSLFAGEYTKTSRDWERTPLNMRPHGLAGHPARKFVKSEKFEQFINDWRLVHAASKLLDSPSALLCKRAIVRSFDKTSSTTTKPHRDKEYFKTHDGNKAITAWIPLGKADLEHGQLIYLQGSASSSDYIDQFVRPDKTLGDDLQKIADTCKGNWLVPHVEPGDVIFHCLNNVHASFDSRTITPRLSCDLRFAADSRYLDQRWNTHWAGDDGL